jgi:hypothetical protein
MNTTAAVKAKQMMIISIQPVEIMRFESLFGFYVHEL